MENGESQEIVREKWCQGNYCCNSGIVSSIQCIWRVVTLKFF